MSDCQPHRRPLERHVPKTSSCALLCLLAGLSIAGCASTNTLSAQTLPNDVPADLRSPSGVSAPETARTPAPAPPAEDARIRQIDDHYATATAEIRQRIQDALAAVKQAPTASEVAALKATISRLEAQVTRLTAATTRTEGVLAGLTARIEVAERAQTERAAKEAAAASPSSPGAIQKTDKSEKPVDPADTSFNEALAGLHGPVETTEPIRRWLELHPTHPEAAEGYLQLGVSLVDRRQPVMAAYYLKHLIAAYPMNLQAQEAKSILSGLSLADAPKPKISPKKTAKPSKTVSPSPKDGKALSKSEVTTPIAAPTTDLPALTRHEAEKLGPASSTTPSPVVPGVASKHTEGPITAPFFAPPPFDLPLKPVVPTR